MGGRLDLAETTNRVFMGKLSGHVRSNDVPAMDDHSGWLIPRRASGHRVCRDSSSMRCGESGGLIGSSCRVFSWHERSIGQWGMANGGEGSRMIRDAGSAFAEGSWRLVRLWACLERGPIHVWSSRRPGRLPCFRSWFYVRHGACGGEMLSASAVQLLRMGIPDSRMTDCGRSWRCSLSVMWWLCVRSGDCVFDHARHRRCARDSLSGPSGPSPGKLP